MKRLIASLLLLGCSSEPAATASSASASASTSKPEASADAGAKETEPPRKEDPTSVHFTTKKISNADFKLVHSEAAMRPMKGNKEYMAIIIYLANYDRGGGDYLPNPSKEGHVRITLNFAAPSTPEVGNYPIDGVLGEGNKLSVGVQNKWDSIGLVKGSGHGEIISLDDKTVQGKVSVKDDQGTSIEASFDVPYTRVQ